MTPSPADLYMLALCLYREARGDGRIGMIAVGCVVRNRTQRNHSTAYAEVIKPWQFSSITATDDPELATWPAESDASWHDAQALAGDILSGRIADTTGGATLYYADTIPFPSSWDRAKVRETVKIGRQTFFTEVA